ncbi:hypothetical protein JL107_07075 [Nakamurella flavida]|uniref:Uncharacterized protein n=1 Tax=Nakamurella flavida TaxID=363630 RepID=A0A939C000_9ACTN|nr:hypothetical protein [Nakamurella flavida]MBM9476203.1 hypothetical protein [Nakamurella flavida]MDP9779699.1 putative membrane protein [Nakamurella flavida]
MLGFVFLVGVLMTALGFFFPVHLAPGRSMWRDGALAAVVAMVLIFPVVGLVLGVQGWGLIGGAVALLALCLGPAIGTAARRRLPGRRMPVLPPLAPELPPNLGR